MKKIKLIMIMMTGLLLFGTYGCGSKSVETIDVQQNVSVEKENDVNEADDKTNEDVTQDDLADASEETKNSEDLDNSNNENVETNPASTDEVIVDDAATSSSENISPFYGIWVGASTNISDMEKMQNEMQSKGLQAEILTSCDWENLNQKKIYVITAGMYETKDDANDNLAMVQNYYADAYVKYSGEYQGEGVAVKTENSSDVGLNESDIIYFYVSLKDDVEKKNDCYLLHGNLEIGKEMKYDVTVTFDDKTVFSNDCDMQFFSHYKKGMTVLEWFDEAYTYFQKDDTDMSLLGVYGVTMTENHVDAIHGIYWWD